MRYLILILCLVLFKVEASDWLNRTIRVDLIVDRSNHRAFNPKHDLLVQSESISSSSGVFASNGQYPWIITTTALSDQGSGIRSGIGCAGTIISSSFVLSDFHCLGRTLYPIAYSIEAYIGSAQWNSSRIPTHFVRTYWYIEPSFGNRPNIALFRIDENITFNPNVQPIRLPFYQDFSYDGWSSQILGFPSSPGGISMPRLQSVEARFLSNNVCEFDFSFFGIYTADDHEMCSIDGRETTESGAIRLLDSFTGGAWIVDEYTDAGSVLVPVIIGIHQWQFVNQTASYGLATRVSHFVEWIETLSQENK